MHQFGIFAKYWQPGAVKTRLAASVGDDLAAEFHRASVQTLIRRFGDLSAHRVLSYTPPDHRDEFAQLCPSDWTLQPQAVGDLGERMRAFFDSAFAAGAARVVLIGSDSPTLPHATIQAAFESLDHHSVALGPTDDGGYYVVAARHDAPDIFSDIPWSTRHVMLATEQRLQASGTDWFRLPDFFDVDRIEDVRRLDAELSDNGPALIFEELREAVRRCLEATGG